MASNLRAFPRLSCGRRARLLFPDMEEEGQVVDLSAGGSKFLPFQLDVLAAWGMPPGLPLKVEIGGRLISATIVWATPNYSAVGCRFDLPLAPEHLSDILCAPTDANWLSIGRSPAPNFGADRAG